jgi:hypothetical protein
MLPKRLTFLLVQFAVTLSGGCGTDTALEGTSVQPAEQPIVGGAILDPSNFPAAGFLRRRAASSDPFLQFCSATLVGSRTVLTAAHCLMDRATIFEMIENGNIEFALGPDQHTVTASGAVVGVYCPSNIDSNPDIALAFLAAPMSVQPMALRTYPLEQTGLPSFNWLYQSVRIIGYGATSNYNQFEGAGVRRSVVLQVVDPAALVPPVAMPNNIPFLVFHANPDNPKGSCFGDSGGPAIHLNPVTGVYEVVGVSSGANSQDCVHSVDDNTAGATYRYQRTDVQHHILCCDASQCSHHGICFMPGICECDAGFRGENCSEVIPVSGCATSPCFPGVVCTDAAPPETSFVCGSCPDGYSGNGVTCTEIDGCAGSPCFPGVVCTDADPPETGFLCGSCPAGYNGDGISCAQISGCADSPCFPGVVCTDAAPPATGFLCGSCPEGYSGDGLTCAEIDECATNVDNCHANAICANTTGNYTCTCTDGFLGNGFNCQPETTPDGSSAVSSSASCRAVSAGEPRGLLAPLLGFSTSLIWRRRRPRGDPAGRRRH